MSNLGDENMVCIKIENLKKRYKTGNLVNTVLDGVTLNVEKGEFIVIYGPSGAGKTTLLNIIGGLDRANEGKIFVNDIDITKFNTNQLNEFTKNNIGFVFQFYNLIQNLTVIENIKMASELVKSQGSEEIILEQMGMEDKKNKMPFELSGGEQQRVSIARAIAKKSNILLCDEPIGALDYENGKNILQLLQDICIKNGVTTILVTHNFAISPMANRVIFMKNGKIVNIEHNEHPMLAKDLKW